MKRKLLFVMALVISAFSTVNAQTWTASAAAAGEFFIYNVGEAKYLTGGNAWGTRASLDEHGLYCTLEAKDGGYAINTGNGQHLGLSNGSPFVDQGANTWVFTPVAGKENTYKISQGDNYLYAVAGSTEIKYDANVPETDYGYWKLASREALTEAANLSAASETNPVDVTFLMSGANFVRNCDGWANNPGAKTDEKNGSWTYTINQNNFVLCGPSGGAQNNTGCEMWNNTFDLYQTVTVPNGKYYVTCDGYGSTNTVIYGNDVSNSFTKTGAINGHNFANAILNIADYKEGGKTGVITVADGKLKVGVKRSTNAGGEWTVVDNFRIYCVGVVDLTDLINQFNSLLTEGKGISGKMNNDVKAALDAAVAKYDGKSYETEAEYADAIAELGGAVNAAKASVESYSNANKYFAKMKAVLDNTNVYTQESYDDYYGTWLAQYEEGTLTEDLNESKAYSTGWHSANYIDDILLSTWTIGDKQCKDYDAGMYINTWSVEGNTDGSEFFAPFFEYWTGDGASLGANTMISKVTSLKPNTNYSFTIRARVRQTDNKTKAAEAIMLQVGEGTPVDISAGTLFGSGPFYIGNFSAMGTTDADGNLTAKITVNADNNISWLSFYNCMVTEGEDLSAFIADYEFALAQVNEELKNEDYADFATDLKAAATTYAAVDRTNKAALIEAKEQLTAALNAYNAVVGPLKGSDISKWTTTGNNGTFVVNTWSVEGDTDGSNMKTPFTQNWIGRGTALTNATMSYTMEGLTPGYYKVSALIRVLDESGKATPSGVFIFANDTIERAYGDNASACHNGVYGRPTVYGYVGEDGKLTIGVKVINTGVNWVSWKNFTVVAAGTELTAEMANNQKEEKRTFEYNMSAQDLQDSQVATLDAALFKENYIVAGKAIEEAYKTEDLNFVQMWITDAHYATFVAPFDVTIPEGVTAYTVPGLESNGYTLVLEEVKTTIPANTPVVLFSEAEVEKEFGGAALGKEPVTEGLLTGVFDFTEITGADKYVLQNQEEVDGVAFYPATDPTTAALVSPNRAYLYIPETAVVAGAKAIRFPGADATGINAINVLTSGKAEIFNAAGARIPSLQKGVNIIRTADGKTSKVLVK